MGGTVELSSEEGTGTAMAVNVLLHKDLHSASDDSEPNPNPDARTDSVSQPSPHVAIIQGVAPSACCEKAESSQSHRRSIEVQQTE